jgi:hypothetical protein
MAKRRVTTTLGLGFAAALASVAGVAGTAAADTAATPVGMLTATQVTGLGACNDLGANVTVTVSSGYAGTAYVASGGGISTSERFMTDASGSGSAVVRNVNPPRGTVGTGTITVNAGGVAGQVSVAVDCPSGKGG